MSSLDYPRRGLNSMYYPGRGFEQPELQWEGIGVAWITLLGGLSSLDYPGGGLRHYLFSRDLLPHILILILLVFIRGLSLSLAGNY